MLKKKRNVAHYTEGALEMHVRGLRFAFARSYNLPPSSLIARSIRLYCGAALVITHQNDLPRTATKNIANLLELLLVLPPFHNSCRDWNGSKRWGRVQLIIPSLLNCSRACLYQQWPIIVAPKQNSISKEHSRLNAFLDHVLSTDKLLVVTKW